MAEGVARVPGAEARLIPVADGIPWDYLESSDAIIFGSPTYNGSLSAKLKQFMEDSSKPAYMPKAWRNKIAAGFANSGAPSGDKLSTLTSIALFAAQHAMIWVGVEQFASLQPEEDNYLGGWLGAMAQSNYLEPPELTPSASDLRTAANLGQRVTQVAAQFAAGRSALTPQ